MSGSFTALSPTCTIFIWLVIFLLDEENLLNMYVRKGKQIDSHSVLGTFPLVITFGDRNHGKIFLVVFLY